MPSLPLLLVEMKDSERPALLRRLEGSLTVNVMRSLLNGGIQVPDVTGSYRKSYFCLSIPTGHQVTKKETPEQGVFFFRVFFCNSGRGKKHLSLSVVDGNVYVLVV